MKKYINILLVLVMGFSWGLSQSIPNWNKLVTASWLKSNLENVVILDIRNGGEEFIPGSIHAPYRIWRSTDPDNPGKIPDLDVLKDNIESRGLSSDKPIVIVFEGKNSSDFGSAARVYWTLKYLGFERLAILNGGLNSYRALPDVKLVSEVELTANKKTRFTPKLQKQYYVGNEGIVKAVKNKDILIDSRSDEQYQGRAKHPASLRYGAITGSKQLWQGDWFVDESAVLKNDNELETVVDSYKIPRDRVIFVYCNTGHWAASNWFVLSEILGYPNVKLYPDSFVKYSRLDDVELINEPSRLIQLWWEIKSWF